MLARRPRTLELRVEGRLGPGVTAKDVILALIARPSASPATPGRRRWLQLGAFRHLDVPDLGVQQFAGGALEFLGGGPRAPLLGVGGARDRSGAESRRREARRLCRRGRPAPYNLQSPSSSSPARRPR